MKKISHAPPRQKKPREREVVIVTSPRPEPSPFQVAAWLGYQGESGEKSAFPTRPPNPKPDISQYTDAVYMHKEAGPLFLARIGEEVIVANPDPRIPTYTGKVERIWDTDDEYGNAAGNVLLWVPIERHHCFTNYLTAPKGGYLLKLADAGPLVQPKKKRGRRKKSETVLWLRSPGEARHITYHPGISVSSRTHPHWSGRSSERLSHVRQREVLIRRT